MTESDYSRKLDELDRVAADADDEPAGSSDLSLDLDLSSPALGDPAGGTGITLGDDDIVEGISRFATLCNG